MSWLDILQFKAKNIIFPLLRDEKGYTHNYITLYILQRGSKIFQAFIMIIFYASLLINIFSIKTNCLKEKVQ